MVQVNNTTQLCVLLEASSLSGAMSVNKSGSVLLENLPGKNLVVFLKYFVCIVLTSEVDAVKPDLLVTMHFSC